MSILAGLPAHRGHFLLESGLHTDLWLTLDALFVFPGRVAPLVRLLAERLRPHQPTAVCGPLQGGAFLAQALATALDVNFYFSEPVAAKGSAGLFRVQYRIPAALRANLEGERVALVDDVISAGSSVRATARDLVDARASVVVAAALLVLGTEAVDYFAEQGTPVETLEQREFSLWRPETCPLCLAREPLENPLDAR